MVKTGAKANKRLTIVVDADAIVAQASPNDNLHIKAVKIAKELNERNALLLYPATAVAEATTHMQRVLNSGATAYGTAVVFSNPDVNVINIDQKTIGTAIYFFSPRTSKKNTLFDCIVAAVADGEKADAIFSFDRFYKKKGFRLVSEIIK